MFYGRSGVSTRNLDCMIISSSGQPAGNGPIRLNWNIAHNQYSGKTRYEVCQCNVFANQLDFVNL